MQASGAETVVVAVDGSEPSYRALDWAATEAIHRSAVLRVVHSLYADPPIGAFNEAALEYMTHELLSAAAEHVRNQPGARPEIDTALLAARSPARALIGESYRASLLVLGTRGHGGFTTLLLGSTAVMVTAHAVCPTAVIPQRYGPSSEDGSIVVGVDATEASTGPLQFAFDRAADRGIGVVALHAWGLPADYSAYPSAPLLAKSDELADHARNRLTETLAAWRTRYPTVPVEERVVQGQTVATLVEASAQHTEVLVVGSRGYGAVAGVVLGSASQGVLRHAHCPVIIAR